MKWLKECNEEKGLRIFGQAITTMNLKSPQCFSLDIFNLFDASPPWRKITLGSPEERIAKMQNPKMRQDCKDQFDNPNKTINLNSIDRTDAKKQGNEQDGGLGLSLRKLVLDSSTNPEHQKFVGKILQEIAEARDQHVVDAFLDVSIEDQLKANWRQQASPSNVQNLKAVANHAYTVGSWSRLHPGKISEGANKSREPAKERSSGSQERTSRPGAAGGVWPSEWRSWARQR